MLRLGATRRDGSQGLSIRIGIDVGGTNTDAVAMDGREVRGRCKRPTSADVASGVVAALEGVLMDAAVDRDEVRAVMIGTTHFTNAVVQRRDLAPVAVLRLCGTATHSLPPMVDWPAEVRESVEGYTALLDGGVEFDGRPITPLDEGQVRAACAEIAARGIGSVAVSCVFAPVAPEQERRVAVIIGETLPGVAITLSSEVGRLGMLQRENAAILNACLRPMGTRVVAGFETAKHALGLTCPLYVSQNDGTLMTAAQAARYPVHTFTSGPTNSMRGAAFLSGLKDAIVVDVGGTTTDVGALVRGFPREASVEVEVGGVLTNFRMPDVQSIGLGGGSLVLDDGDSLAIGPVSVGYDLVRRALVFGGDTLTATDVAVAAGRASIGDPAGARAVAAIADAGVARIDAIVADAIDRAKTSRGDVPVVLVGGGSVLLSDAIEGASPVVRPPHFDVANAVGAAIAQASGEVERVAALTETARAEALERAKAEAVERAVAAGADPASIEFVEVEEIPLAYLPSNATKLRVKAVGDLVL